MRLEKMYPDMLDEARKKSIPVFIPVGVMEYHCNHLPLGTDTQTPLYLLERLEQERDIIIAPPVWYGCASYAVKGPEGYSIDMDGEVLNKMMYNIYLSMLRSGFRRVFTVLYHQTEDFNPMELACRKAARKLVFEFLDQTKGYGWWGKNENKEFYQQMSAEDNPWNWIQVMGAGRNLTPKALAKWGGGDHAGRCECSMLEYLWPGTIKLDRLPETDDWFAQDSINMSHELGSERSEEYVENFVKFINDQRGIK